MKSLDYKLLEYLSGLKDFLQTNTEIAQTGEEKIAVPLSGSLLRVFIGTKNRMGRPLKGRNIPGCSGAISLHLILEYFLI